MFMVCRIPKCRMVQGVSHAWPSISITMASEKIDNNPCPIGLCEQSVDLRLIVILHAYHLHHYIDHHHHSPFFCITSKNLTITLDDGLMSTCFLPRSSAFEIVLRASANTLIRTMVPAYAAIVLPGFHHCTMVTIIHKHRNNNISNVAI